MGPRRVVRRRVARRGRRGNRGRAVVERRPRNQDLTNPEQRAFTGRERVGLSLEMSMRPFEAIVAEHGPVVMRVCRALVGREAAEDAWSETFLAALRAYPDLRPDSNVRGWLVTIAHHKAIDQIRRASRLPHTTDDLSELPAAEVEPTRIDDELRAALDELAPKQRVAVVYRYLADLSYAEIGTLLDSSEAAARRSAADGIANLRTTYPKGSRS